MSRMVSFAVLIGILAVITVLFYRVMASFLLPLFMAALLGVIFQPLQRWVLNKCGGQRYVAAGITSVLVLLSVLTPTALVITMAALQGIELAERVRGTDVQSQLTNLRKQFDLEIANEQDLRLLEAGLKHWRNKQRTGEPIELEHEAVQVLLERLTRLEEAIKTEGTGAVRTDATRLREALVQLKESQPLTLAQDEALQAANAEFRIFKREYLGGSVTAWLKEAVNPTDEQLENLLQSTTSTAGSPLLALGGDTLAIVAKLLFGIIITVAALFFFFAEGATMLDAVIRLSPLEERYVRELVAEFERVCRAVVTATLLSAVVQGILAGIGFYFAGLTNSVALLTLLTTVLAMVPFTGAATVWVPVCFYIYFVQDRLVAAGLLAIYGTFIISLADNVIKPIVLHGQSNLHPLLALLSILGGIQALGPIGILIGPMVVVFLQTLLKILQRELLSIDRTAAAAASAVPPDNPHAVEPPTVAGPDNGQPQPDSPPPAPAKTTDPRHKKRR
ncbi:MAG TPA: AI-2E family transporter, partial [Pirellulaceae bacterium]|nr:AI-2E family transporter [Pirellulaceae bacterium]